MPSAISKAKGNKIASKCNVNIGDLVYLKMEGNKLKGRECYIITGINKDNATLQKLNGRLFAVKKYELPLTHILPANKIHNDNNRHYEWDNIPSHSDSDNNSTVTLFTPEEQAAEDHTDEDDE